MRRGRRTRGIGRSFGIVMEVPVRTWTLALVIALVAPLAAGQDDKAETECRARLQRLGAGVRAYGMIDEGRRPARLSDLYYEGLVERLSDFSCPASGATIAAPAEIDAKSDFTLEPPAAAVDALVRERSPRHSPDRLLAACADGTVKPIAAPAGIPGVTAPPVPSTTPTPAPQSPIFPPLAASVPDIGRAHELYSSGRYVEAIREYDIVLEQSPDNYQARLERAVARLWTNDVRGARADWTTLARANPNDLASRRLGAGLELLVGDPQLARREAEALVRAAPQDALVRLLLGQASAWTGDANTANESFALARRLDPALLPGLYEQAAQFLRAGVFSMAYLQFSAVVWMDPNQRGAYFGLGLAIAHAQHVTGVAKAEIPGPDAGQDRRGLISLTLINVLPTPHPPHGGLGVGDISNELRREHYQSATTRPAYTVDAKAALRLGPSGLAQGIRHGDGPP